MNQRPNPDMLVLAREVRGMTQKELAATSGIDQGKISRYEGGIKQMPEGELEVLAEALSFPTSFFLRQGKRLGAEPGEIFHRKRDRVTAAKGRQIDGLTNLYRLSMERLLNGVDLDPPYSIPQCDIDEHDNVAQIAAAVRARWQMPSGPVSNLIEQLEAASCMVFRVDFGIEEVDETAQWIEPHPPIILVNSRAPGDRLRFSLAHALGHLVMHRGKYYKEMEREADEFAAAFLMPEDDIRPDLDPVTINHLLELKSYWKVSMQALIMRARDIGEITERRTTSLFQMLSRIGYRKSEPNPVPQEIPELITTLLTTYKEEMQYSDEELADLVNLHVDDFRLWYYAESAHLKLVRKPDRRAG